MIIKNTAKKVTTNFDSEIIPVGISQRRGPAVIIKMVAEQYPNPLQTLMTEYVQNALDSHLYRSKNDPDFIDRPIEITLPTEFDQHYIVRDYGRSMTHVTIKTVYAIAAETDKDEDDDYLGGFGIGKLVFSQYGGELWLTTWIDGLKTVYFYQLKDGFGGIRIVSQEESDEPQGVEVKIHIPKDDHKPCHALAPYIYSFLPTPPIIKGVKNPETFLDREYIFGEERFSVPKHRLHANQKGMIATIGGLPFNIDSYYVHNKYRALVNTISGVLHFEGGELEFPPNRSSLTYSELTKDALNKRLGEFMESYSNIVEDKVDEMELFDARKYISGISNYNVYEGDNNFFSLAKLCGNFKDGFKWRGVKVPQRLNAYGSSAQQFIESIRGYFNGVKLRSWNNERIVRNEARQYITFNENKSYIIIESDFGRNGKAKRLKKFISEHENQDNYSIVITLKEGVTIDDFSFWSDIPVDKLINIKDLPMPEREASAGGGSGSRLARTVKKGDILRYSDLDRARDYNYTMPWGVHAWEEVSEDVDITELEGVYIPIKRYKPDLEGFDIENHSMLVRKLYIVNTFKGGVKLYGVKPKEVKNLGDKMLSIDEYIESISGEVVDTVQQYGQEYLSIKDVYSHRNTIFSIKDREFTDPSIQYLKSKLCGLHERYKELEYVGEVIKMNNLMSYVNPKVEYFNTDVKYSSNILKRVYRIVEQITTYYNTYSSSSISIHDREFENYEAKYYYKNRKRFEREQYFETRKKLLTQLREKSNVTHS